MGHDPKSMNGNFTSLIQLSCSLASRDAVERPAMAQGAKPTTRVTHSMELSTLDGFGLRHDKGYVHLFLYGP